MLFHHSAADRNCCECRGEYPGDCHGCHPHSKNKAKVRAKRKIECRGTAYTYSHDITDTEDAVKCFCPMIEAKPELEWAEKYRDASRQNVHRQPFPPGKVNAETPLIRAKIIKHKAVNEPQGNDCRCEHEKVTTLSHDCSLVARSRPIARIGYLLVRLNLTRSRRVALANLPPSTWKKSTTAVMTSCDGMVGVAGYP